MLENEAVWVEQPLPHEMPIGDELIVPLPVLLTVTEPLPVPVRPTLTLLTPSPMARFAVCEPAAAGLNRTVTEQVPFDARTMPLQPLVTIE